MTHNTRNPSTTSRTLAFTLCGVLTMLWSLPLLAAYEESVTYDANGFVASRTDKRDTVTSFTHDSAGRELSRTEAAGTSAARTITTEWDTTLGLPQRIGYGDHSVSFSYDNRGLLTQRTLTDLATSQARSVGYRYDERGQLIEVDGPRTDVSDITSYAYNALGNLTTITNALGHTTRITAHDANGQPLTLVDANGLVTKLAYSPRGWLVRHEAGGEVTTYDYDKSGNLTRTTTPAGAIVNYEYDAAHRLIAISDNNANRIEFTLDAMGNRLAQTVRDASGQLQRTASASYDQFSQLSKTIGAAGQTASYTYDGNGNLTQQTDPNGHASGLSYDPLERLTQQRDALGGITRYGYDNQGRLTSVTDPNGHTTTYRYHGLDDLVEQVSPDTGTTTFQYDTAGNLIQHTDAKGQTTRYGYDALNRLTQQTLADGSVISYSYDTAQNGIGHLAASSSPSGTTSYSYDLHGRLTARVEAISVGNAITQLTTRYSYNANGQLATMTYPSGKVVGYQYASTGQLSALTLDGQPLLSAINWQPFGPVTSWQWGNGSSYSRHFDQDGQLTQYKEGSSNKSLSYDPAGNITGIGSALYSYDALDRLVAANDAAFHLYWNYDANGNRLSEGSGWSNLAYTIDAESNQLLGVGSNAYQLDANGSLVHDGANSYQYDVQGRLVSVNDGTTARYRYNAQGQRVYKAASTVTGDGNGDGVITPSDLKNSSSVDCTDLKWKQRRRMTSVNCVATQIGASANNGQSAVSQAKRDAQRDTRLFAYEGWQLLGEYTSSGLAMQETVWLAGMPVATLQNGKLYNIYPDQLGTPRVITNSANAVIWKWESDPFGVAVANEDADGDGVKFSYNLRFPGQYFDAETGKHYNYFRDYDPGVGRYVESDPIGLEGGLNTYAYVLSDPLNHIDPKGLEVDSTWNSIYPPSYNTQANACYTKCKAKVKVCVGFVEVEGSSSPGKWAGGYVGLRLIPGLSAQSGLECGIECGDPSGFNLKGSATAGAGLGVSGSVSVGVDGVAASGGIASGSIYGISPPAPGLGYRF